jgi:hypothetical protein
MEQQFKTQFDKLSRATLRKAPARNGGDIDARLDRALAAATEIGNARRRAEAHQLAKRQTQRADSRALLAKCDALLSEINGRLGRLEKLAEREALEKAKPAPTVNVFGVINGASRGTAEQAAAALAKMSSVELAAIIRN